MSLTPVALVALHATITGGWPPGAARRRSHSQLVTGSDEVLTGHRSSWLRPGWLLAAFGAGDQRCRCAAFRGSRWGGRQPLRWEACMSAAVLDAAML
jgi:hypothetical protein